MEKQINPVRIVKTEKVLLEENILKDNSSQAPCILKPYNGTVEDCITIEEGGYIVLDFGCEIHGRISITVQSASELPGEFKITFGESVMEALSTLGEKNSNNYHSVKYWTMPVWQMSTQEVGDTAFRFVKLQASKASIIVRAVKAVPRIREIEYIGSFECNDGLLNKIWNVGAYTVQLNMHEYLWDGAKRDRLVWIGDMHPETSTIGAVFGVDECVTKSLDFAKMGTPPDEWMNNIATYSMWWIIIHYDLYMQWGDFGYLQEQKKYMKKLIDNTFLWVDNDFESDGVIGFVDWSSKDTESEVEGRKSIVCIALERADKIFDVLGETEYTEKCREYVRKIRSEIIDKESNKRMSALTILSGRDKTFAKKVLEGNSAEEMSCFIGYYVLKAKAMLGEYTDALDIIREYWGGMIKMGATTFWEDFDIKWMENAAGIDKITPDGMNDVHGDFGKHCYTGFRHSLCHGWSSGPTPFLSEQIGGIEILKAGCKKVRISPNLGDLEWIKVEYPTPYGNIKIHSIKENGKIKTDISAPVEIEIVR